MGCSIGCPLGIDEIIGQINHATLPKIQGQLFHLRLSQEYIYPRGAKTKAS